MLPPLSPTPPFAIANYLAIDDKTADKNRSYTSIYAIYAGKTNEIVFHESSVQKQKLDFE